MPNDLAGAQGTLAPPWGDKGGSGGGLGTDPGLCARTLERFSDSLGSDWARDERRERRGEVRRERVVDTAIECLQRFSPAECRNCFRHCGYSIATQS